MHKNIQKLIKSSIISRFHFSVSFVLINFNSDDLILFFFIVILFESIPSRDYYEITRNLSRD